jgi:hypothetical protein
MKEENEWRLRISPTLGEGFAGTPYEAWNIKKYDPEIDGNKNLCIMGCYGLPDLYSIWKHKGKKYILWCGSDIRHFTNGYWLDSKGYTRANPDRLAGWIDTQCESYVENTVERDALLRFGIRSKVIPSFLGDIKKFKLSYKYSTKPKVYTSVSGDDFDLYGWHEIGTLAKNNPKVTFYLYGNKKEWYSNLKNVIVRGRVSQEVFDEETSKMQGALRLTRFDGASEILIKSILWGQYPISPHIEYPYMMKDFKFKKNPNIKGRNYYKKMLNRYPWNEKS